MTSSAEPKKKPTAPVPQDPNAVNRPQSSLDAPPPCASRGPLAAESRACVHVSLLILRGGRVSSDRSSRCPCDSAPFLLDAAASALFQSGQLLAAVPGNLLRRLGDFLELSAIYPSSARYSSSDCIRCPRPHGCFLGSEVR